MKKQVLIATAISLALVLVYIILKSANIITFNCPFSYLNPWQYFFYCTGFNFIVYLVIGIVSFTIAFHIQKKKK